MNFSLSRMNGWNAFIGTVTVAVALQGCTSPCSPMVEHKPVPVVDGAVKVRELRKQIRERDKRIEELESQLEALKLIDQDSVKLKPPIKPPTTLEPIE